MILTSLLLAIQAAPAETVPEIVVLGNLRSVQASVGQDREGNWHCSLSKSTGRPRLDDRFCRAVTQCVREGASDQQAVSSCIRETRARLMRRVERAMERNAS
ncbi:hypothetical protein NAP1_13258 [Erythrobacter sp. NAP1]|uniref:hypothetical protein n=1 Tax=Erythrobacter sp. NAP1 TaxID=237727 RepID=UPI00006878F0|nr:hypothetical protein [Erythrobacter sp. NAP1]EAQ28569.1 hypothetical protein NAP1_13258 [Erythrobacter sp. NAP1]